MAMKTPIPSLPAILSAAASTAATVVLIRNIAGDILPRELRRYLRSRLVSLFSPARSSQTVITVHDFQDFQRNQLYADAEIYLSAKISASTNRFRASVPLKETQVILSIDSDQEIIDVFGEAMFIWKKVSYEKEIMSRNGNEEWRTTTVQYFELRFDMKHRDLALNSYFSHIQSESSKLRKAQQSLKIHMLSNTSSTFGNKWTPANLDHPATFSTLAMDPEMKRMIIEDLDMFVNRKDFYRRVGKAWKRGYLLFGPPGTGKSSLIAAIANYLKFDIYDLELSVLSHNTNLRTLLTTTANRSILVVEDIDCSLDLDDRRTQTRPLGEPPQPGRTLQTTAAHIPLSGLLNFMDGLWSSCGDERIIIFTTNHKERLDPALLRPGRMDLHIHMSYCTPCGFRMLASNYIGLIEHPLLTEIEQLVTRAKVTPAEVGEQLMRTPDPETALKGLLEFIKSKIEENGRDEGDSAEKESKDKTEEAG